MMLGDFSVFFWGCLCCLVRASVSCCSQPRFARASAWEETLALRSDQKKVFSIFLSVWVTFLVHSGVFIAFGGLHCIRGPSLHSGVFIAFGGFHCIRGLSLYSWAFIAFLGRHRIRGHSLHSGVFIVQEMQCCSTGKRNAV